MPTVDQDKTNTWATIHKYVAIRHWCYRDQLLVDLSTDTWPILNWQYNATRPIYRPTLDWHMHTNYLGTENQDVGRHPLFT